MDDNPDRPRVTPDLVTFGREARAEIERTLQVFDSKKAAAIIHDQAVIEQLQRNIAETKAEMRKQTDAMLRVIAADRRRSRSFWRRWLRRP